MDEASVDYLTLKGMIADLPAKERETIERLADELEMWMTTNGVHAQMAISLVMLKILQKKKDERKN